MQQELKTDKNGKVYSGTPIGYTHEWRYENCIVEETKEEPDRWRFRQTATKRKVNPTTIMGMKPKTQYHWLIIGNQMARKTDENTYEVELIANKFKIGHKKPEWQRFSYEYQDQIKAGNSRNQMIIKALERELEEIRNGGKRE